MKFHLIGTGNLCGLSLVGWDGDWGGGLDVDRLNLDDWADWIRECRCEDEVGWQSWWNHVTIYENTHGLRLSVHVLSIHVDGIHVGLSGHIWGEV